MPKILKRLIISYFAIILAFSAAVGILSTQYGPNIPFLALSSLVLALILIFITRSIYIRPLQQMRDMTARMAQGDFSKRLDITMHDEWGDLSRLLNHMSDEIRNTIQKITNDRNELQAILSSMVEGVIVIGKDEKILYVSPNFCDLMELRSRETKGRPYWEVFQNHEINDSLREATLKVKAVKKEVTVAGPHETYFSMQISPVLDLNGKLLNIVAVFHDITELKKFERMRSEFVANVSHELKTPLTSIKGFVETLMAGAVEDPATSHRFLDIIRKQTERLENLVNDLLTLSALESKETELEHSAEPLLPIIESLIQLNRTNIERKGHRIQIDIPGNLPEIIVDRPKIEQVFLNLFDNAIKFTPSNGTITLKAERDGGYIRIDVKDSGIGIPQDQRSRIFERFYRIDKARTSDQGGTGLGLSIVKHIVQAHNGKIAVHSIPGQGSTFSVFLPCS